MKTQKLHVVVPLGFEVETVNAIATEEVLLLLCQLVQRSLPPERVPFHLIAGREGSGEGLAVTLLKIGPAAGFPKE